MPYHDPIQYHSIYTLEAKHRSMEPCGGPFCWSDLESVNRRQTMEDLKDRLVWNWWLWLQLLYQRQDLQFV